MKSIALVAVVAMFLLLMACTTQPLPSPSDVEIPASEIPEQPAEAIEQEVAEEIAPGAETVQEEDEMDELLQDDLDDAIADMEQLE